MNMVNYRSRLLSVLVGSAISLAAMGCAEDEIEQGEYVLLRVAFADVQVNPSCYPDGEIPKEIKDDSTSIRAGATLALFRGPNENYFLDAADDVMEGTLEGETFTFKGKSVDVEYKNGKPAEVIHDADKDGLEDNFDDPSVDADKDGLEDNFDEVVDTDNDGLDDRYEDEDVDVNNDKLDDRFTEIKPAIDGDKHTFTTNQTLSFTISDKDVAGTNKVSHKEACSGATCPTELMSCTQSGEFVGTLVEEAGIEHQL
jgi:hypothetical protein